MSKINIKFNNKNYSIDLASLADATAAFEEALKRLNSGSGNNGNIIEFDGDLTGWETIDGSAFGTDGAVFVKVSNSYTSKEQLEGATMIYKYEGSDYSETFNSSSYIEENTMPTGEAMLLLGPSKFGHTNNVFISIKGDLSAMGIPLEEGSYFIVYPEDETYIISISCLTKDTSTPEEERLEGDGAEYYTLAPTALSFRSTAPLNELQEIQINGVTVDPSNYTLEEGSTIVTFPIEYLKTLNIGSYEVTVISENKSVKGDFTVAAPELNEYGFYYDMPYVACVEYFDDDLTMLLLHKDYTAHIITAGATSVKTNICAQYSLNDSDITISSAIGTFTGSISSTSIYINEITTSFIFCDNVAVDRNCIYLLDDSESYQVFSCTNNTRTTYGIQNSINGQFVKVILMNAFAECRNLTKISIPEAVVEIGGGAFFGCHNLQQVTFQSNASNLSIGNGAFEDCVSLTNIILPLNLTEIKSNAFINCTNLASITYMGTMTQWDEVRLHDNWHYNVPATHVQCSDGQVAL